MRMGKSKKIDETIDFLIEKINQGVSLSFLRKRYKLEWFGKCGKEKELR